MNDFKPNVLSDVLLAEYVLKKEDNKRFKLDPRWNSSEDFDDYVVLYKIALVLIALLIIERRNPNYFKVRLFFEKAIFTEGNIQKLYFYHQVKSAMDKLGELLDTSYSKLDNLKDQNDKMPWTMTCLRAAKILKNDQAIIHSRSAVIGMGWAMAWLRETGIIETNPATLDLFSLMWIDNYIAINNFLNECNPIGA
jgi:hypothetical protein